MDIVSKKQTTRHKTNYDVAALAARSFSAVFHPQLV